MESETPSWVVGIELSPRSKGALQFARWLRETLHARVLGVYVSEMYMLGVPPSDATAFLLAMRSEAEHWLASLGAGAPGAAIDATQILDEVEPEDGGVSVQGFDDLDNEQVRVVAGGLDVESGGVIGAGLTEIIGKLRPGNPPHEAVPEGSGMAVERGGGKVLPPLVAADLVAGGDQTREAFEDALMVAEALADPAPDHLGQAVETLLPGLFHLTTYDGPAGESHEEAGCEHTRCQQAVASADDGHPLGN